MSRVLLVTPDAAFEQRLRAALPVLAANGLRRVNEHHLDVDPAKMVAAIVGADFQVVCLGPGLADVTALELARLLDRDHPDVTVVMVGEPNPALWQEAMRAGVRDVLSPGSDAQVLVQAFEQARQAAERQRARATVDTDRRRSSSRIVTVLSAKGGSGKTLIATNLAVGIAAAGIEVALVDLDVQFGDVAAALQLQPEHSLADVASGPGPVDKTVLKIFLTRHSSGVFVLCAPELPGQADEIRPEHVAQVLPLLAAEFPVVVIDTSAGLDEIALAAVEVSTDLVLVCTKDVASVRCLRKEIDALDQLGLIEARRRFVLNRCDAKVGLEVADIESVLGMKADVSVPSSRAVPLSMNVGSPVVKSEPRSPAARRLLSLVGLFIPGEPSGSSGPLSRLLSVARGGRR